MVTLTLTEELTKEKTRQMLFLIKSNAQIITTEEQLEHFVKYKSEMENIIATCEEEAFKDGYKIATRLFLSCFDKAEHIFDDIM